MHALTQPCRDSRSANTQAGMRRAWANLADSLGRSRRRNGSDNALPRCHGGEQRNGRLRLSLRHPGRQCTGLLPDRSNHRLRGRSPAEAQAFLIVGVLGGRLSRRSESRPSGFSVLPGRFGLRAPTVGNCVLGGFTTFSAFGIETVRLLRDGSYLVGSAYVLLQLAIGLSAVAAGLRLGQAFKAG